jgi:DNA-binding response OmpR family regulator
MATVLVVDDEARVVTFLTRALVAEGHDVVAAADGNAALRRLADGDVDLVLLDLVMPKRNGLEVLTSLESWDQRPPVIVLSAVTDVAARVRALDRGAVDYVTKPFHLPELAARVRRHLAETAVRPIDATRYLSAGGFTLDLDRRSVRSPGGDVTLSEREFAVLAHLVRRSGDVCRRDALLHDVWGTEADAGSNVVDVCVKRLRQKLPGLPVETVRGVGYCFQARRHA